MTEPSNHWSEWEKSSIDYSGWIERKDARALLARASLGLAYKSRVPPHVAGNVYDQGLIEFYLGVLVGEILSAGTTRPAVLPELVLKTITDLLQTRDHVPAMAQSSASCKPRNTLSMIQPASGARRPLLAAHLARELAADALAAIADVDVQAGKRQSIQRVFQRVAEFGGVEPLAAGIQLIDQRLFQIGAQGAHADDVERVKGLRRFRWHN